MQIIDLNGSKLPPVVITQPRADFGSAEGNKSGFYESVGNDSTNTPMPGQWNHLIECRHSNLDNNYAFQLAASFFFQRFFVRSTNDNGAQPWVELFHTGNAVEPWKEPILSSNFVPNFPNHQSFRFRKNFVTNSVEFVGTITSRVTLTANSSYLVMTLPEGYRPNQIRLFIVSQGINTSGNFTAIPIRIQPNGEIWIVPTVSSTNNYSVWLEFSMPLV